MSSREIGDKKLGTQVVNMMEQLKNAMKKQNRSYQNQKRGSSRSKTAKPRDVRTDGTADPRSVPFLPISGSGGARGPKSLLGL